MNRTTQHYRDLFSLVADKVHERISVCIVTPDLLGPVKNGGIGTACSYLAYALAEAGHRVHVLLTQCGVATDNCHSWKGEYKSRNIKVTIAESLHVAHKTGVYFPHHPPLHMAHVVHDWLARQADFDLILFMEWQGSGFYALHAKKCGLRFLNTVMAVVVHSPSLWHSTNNAAVPTNPIQACTWHMERRSIEMADVVISPSAHMLDWCRAHGFRLPDRAFVQPNLLEWPDEYTSRGTAPVEEIVFFGRLEYRKGLEQFCTALDILARRGSLPPGVSFLGKCAWMGNEHCLLYIARRSQEWKNCTLSLFLHHDHEQAVSYLCGEGRLAVMPSVADNSPYTVYECLVAGIPFLARDVGGIAELIAPEDREAVLFGDNPRDLADRIEALCGKAPCRVSPGLDLAGNCRAWCEGLAALTALLRGEPAAQPAMKPPFISVCLVHYNRPHLLVQAIASLRSQDYPHFEVILADDGSSDPEACQLLDSLEPEFSQRGWRILRLKNGYPARARNVAARIARGDWLLFLDDDNVAKPHMLRFFARAAQACGTGFISTSFDVFEGLEKPSPQKITERFFPLGDMVAYSVIHNTLGDTTSLISRASFERMNGFREDYGLGHEDFELFLRMVLSGEAVGVIPDSLFWYRRASAKSSVQTGTSAPANRMRSLRPFMECWPASISELALMTHGMAVAQGFYPSPQADGPDSAASVCCLAEDPQSDAVLSRVASHLEATGRQPLAEQILASAKDSASFACTRTSLLGMYARQAAREGNVAHLKKHLAAFAEAVRQVPEEDRIGICNTFYIQLLESLPETDALNKLRLKIIENLKKSPVDSIRVNLAIAAGTVPVNTDQAVLYFFRALCLAEKDYLSLRPDVAAAIGEGAFFCALQHYALHGRKDRTAWPEASLFARTLAVMDSAVALVCRAHEHSYKYADTQLSEMLIHSLQETR